MRISERFGLLLSPRRRLLNQLVTVAAKFETLAGNLARHAEMCDLPTLKGGLERMAEVQATYARALCELLPHCGFWPKLSAADVYDGSSNWARLHHDLALQVEILRALHSQVPEWTGIDAPMAERLREFALLQEQQLGQLRDFTLKCDPQALD